MCVTSPQIYLPLPSPDRLPWPAGMSGFMKVAQRPKEGTEKEGASADDKEEPQAAGGRHAALASASAATGPIGPSHDASSDDDEEGEEGSAPDLRKQMVKRHQKVCTSSQGGAAELQELRSVASL